MGRGRGECLSNRALGWLMELAPSWSIATSARLPISGLRGGPHFGRSKPGKPRQRARGGLPELNAALAKPLRSFEWSSCGPISGSRTGRVDTVAYRHDDGLAMVHQLISDVPGRKVYGTVLERF
jgi:hypothetical protein